ncbi:NAD(P)H-binding protein [Nonomuraea sp. NPDC046570]|uniref:SDR family oxidoreductase n=1 Tax=Nonomuraea sp. NPDC046570 TaxID=3155255 RepID=UPI00340161E2
MTVLVTGATGNVGKHVIAHLAEAGRPVRALTRRPGKANFPEGVEVAEGDLTVAGSLERALDGVTAVHLINFGGDDYAPLGNGEEIVETLLKAGVGRVTLLSGWTESTLEPAVRAGDLEWTYIQPTEFMSNALDWAKTIRSGGEVREPFVNTKTVMVHEADIADVIVRGLTEDGHHGRTYGLTGAERLDVHDKLRIIGEAIGRTIPLVELTEEQFRTEAAANWVPDEMIEFQVRVFGDVAEDAYQVGPTVEEHTGRPARTFAQWARENASAFQAP